MLTTFANDKGISIVMNLYWIR